MKTKSTLLLGKKSNNGELMLLYQYNILKLPKCFESYGEIEPKIISKFKLSTHK